MFSIYEDKVSSLLNSNLIYLLHDNSYDNYDSMKASTISSNYVYYEEEGKYNRVVAITKNKDNIEKIREVYGSDLSVEEYLLDNDAINNKLDEYDVKLESLSGEDEIKGIIMEMINIYKDEDDIKMVKIS